MKFIVSINLGGMIDADSHAEAVRKALEKVDHEGITTISVCDMEIGMRETWECELNAFPDQCWRKGVTKS